MQPQYHQTSQAPMPYIDCTLELKKQRNVITLLLILLSISVLINALVGILVIGSGASIIPNSYKEYSSLAGVYQKAALGEKVKVTITTYEPASASSGFVTLADSDKVGVIVRIPLALKPQIKLFYGRNIVYGQITERNGPSLYLDVERVEP